MDNTIYKLEKAALEIRKDLLKLCTMQTIHIGGDLSSADVMVVLWQYVINYDSHNPNSENRDRFILSKGHASAVTSFNQAAIGCFSKEDVFNEYATDGGRFSMHSCKLVNPFVEVSTGSLGHGFPIACGIAGGLKLKNSKSKVYVLMGDGEQSEGSVWEAAMNAVKLKLNNLIAIIDNNGLEADGKINDITALGNIAEKYKTFGWDVIECNGNNITELVGTFNKLNGTRLEKPTVIVCHTIKGKGVSFMENQVKWHAGKITIDQYNQAIKELEGAFYLKWEK